MKLYAVLRRGGWRSAVELEEEATASLEVANDPLSDRVRWIRSYVLDEEGAYGTVCIYEATSPEAIRRHAAASGLPVTEIVRVEDTVVVRRDPARDRF